MKTNSHSIKLELSIASPRFIALCLLAGLLLALGLTGCKDSSSTAGGPNAGAPANIAGDYALVSVDGKAVPCVVSHEGRDVTVKSGRFTINADGTCRSQSVFAVLPSKDVNRLVEATYTVSGANLTMHWKGAGTTTGRVQGSDFTMNNEGMIFAYRK
jgi:hypothetical protein